MKKRILSIMLCLCMILSLLPLSASAAEAPVNVTVVGTEDMSRSAGVVELVNEARKEAGLAPLSRNTTLSALAMQRAAEIALYYDSEHLRPDGSSCSTIIDGIYTGWTLFAENIAIGQTSEAAVMEDWMNSAGHKANILDGEFTQIGVGCFYAGGVYCWVQLFGNSSSNTTVTDSTGTSAARYEVSILPNYLDLSPSGTQKLQLDKGSSVKLTITSKNPGYGSAKPVVVPICSDVLNDAGRTIATVTVDDEGTIVIKAASSGTGTAELPVYEGQSNPLKLEIIVPGEEPEPTEPDPTESTPTEPAPTDPEPTKPEPTEPDPTEPEPTEPEPTEPKPTDPEDNEIIASGNCGRDVTWTLTGGGLLTISGKGAMDNGSAADVPWYSHREQILRVVVENGVTTICDYAFDRCTRLTSLELPKSVTSLGYRFCGGCTRLTSVTIGAGVTAMESYAFADCTSLTSVTLPDSLAEMGGFVFSGCSALTTVNIPLSLTAIPQYTFSGTGLKELVIPATVTDIGLNAFRNCTALERLLVPDSVTYVPANAFDGCTRLTIHCYQLSYIHLFATSEDIPVVILDEDPATPVYPITATVPSGGGTIRFSSDTSPANRYVLVLVEPREGYHLDAIYYTCDSEEQPDLQFEQVSDTELVFFMPPCAVTFEVYFAPTESPFEDVKETDYFYEPVLWAVSYGITGGVSDTRFGPHNPCTRAQVVTFLWRAAGSPEPESTVNPFSDVKKSDYFYKAVLWAVENGITSGTSTTTFGSSNPCTRSQVVTFLWRACGAPDPSGSENPFTDVKQTDYFYKAVLWAVEHGITGGISATHFGPGSTCTRAQVVTFLYKTVNG